MREIKFRGEMRGFDYYAFGDLRHRGDEVFVDGYRVKPETVAQLVGYDANGNEVYEGDKLVSTKNSDCVCSAYFEPFPEQDDVIKPNHFSNFVLQKTINCDIWDSIE